MPVNDGVYTPCSHEQTRKVSLTVIVHVGCSVVTVFF